MDESWPVFLFFRLVEVGLDSVLICLSDTLALSFQKKLELFNSAKGVS